MANVLIEVGSKVADFRRKQTPNETGIKTVLRIDGCALHFNAATRAISMEGSRVGAVRYNDGSAILIEDHGEPMIGSALHVGGWENLRADASVSGAFRADDSLFGIVRELNRKATWLLLGALTNVMIYPDHAVGGYDTTLQADLVREESPTGSGSRYLVEFFGHPSGDTTVYIRSSLLRVTGGFRRDGATPATVLVVTNRI